MPMTVLSVGFPFAPVGRQAVGGSEQVLSDLDGALVMGGDTSLVVACEGSETLGKLVTIPLLHNVQDEAGRRRSGKQFQAAIDRVLSRQRVDVIHMHGMDFHEYTLPREVPVVVTLHMPLAWYGSDIWSWGGEQVEFCCVSETQRRYAPKELQGMPVVANGVPFAPLRRRRSNSEFALVLGRVCPEKNAHEAFVAGTLAGTRVLMGGQVFAYPGHREYFAEMICPHLGIDCGGVDGGGVDGWGVEAWGFDGARAERAEARRAPQHEFLGALSVLRRQELLAGAKCLLHPTLAPETSSLVAMEALAAGTPVIAYPSGALPEIVEDGVTGFLVESAEEMARAIRKVDQISPDACRAAAMLRFSNRRMLHQYFRIYNSLVGRRRVEKVYA